MTIYNDSEEIQVLRDRLNEKEKYIDYLQKLNLKYELELEKKEKRLKELEQCEKKLQLVRQLMELNS